MPKIEGYDFCGWATKNNLKCSDGRIIRHGAFKFNNGSKVPLVWNHQHNAVGDILGHAILEERDEGIYAYGYFNNSPAGRDAKEAVKHGDVGSLSIWANSLQQTGMDVIHGIIREVSLVVAGANPGAFIESVLAHGEPMDPDDDECLLHTGDGIIIQHAEPIEKPDDNPEKDDKAKSKEEPNKEKTPEDIFNSLNDEQKELVYGLIGSAIEDGNNDKEKKDEEDKKMKHNIFSDGVSHNMVLIHSDEEKAFFEKVASQGISLKAAVKENLETNGFLAHALDATGMETAKGKQTYGINDIDMLFPEYKTLNTPPEFISREMGWVQKVMNGVHHTPFSRIKSIYANITEDEARAKGYIKGKQKKTEVFTTLKRTTSPTTIYKLQKIDRDDIIDITDFDVVMWIKAEMRLMLDEEIARSILIGDGRQSDAEDKINEENIRPIVKDVPLFNVRVPVKVPANATSGEIASATIDEIVRARKHYKGSGDPSFYTTEDVLTEMLLLKDGIGHRLYKTVEELATALRVKEIITVEPMSGYNIDINDSIKNVPLIGTIVNLNDYNVGADKGGEVSMFDDFDIDFNKMTYLIETRISGALIKPFSALTFGLQRTTTSEGGTEAQQGVA